MSHPDIRNITDTAGLPLSGRAARTIARVGDQRGQELAHLLRDHANRQDIIVGRGALGSVLISEIAKMKHSAIDEGCDSQLTDEVIIAIAGSCIGVAVDFGEGLLQQAAHRRRWA